VRSGSKINADGALGIAKSVTGTGTTARCENRGLLKARCREYTCIVDHIITGTFALWML
jgi:hypothetical protein